MVNKKKYKYIEYHKDPKREFYEALELLFPRLTSPKLVEWAAEMLMGHLSFDTLCDNRSKYLGPITPLEIAPKYEVSKPWLKHWLGADTINMYRMPAADRAFAYIAMRTTYHYFHEILGKVANVAFTSTVDYSFFTSKRHYAATRYLNLCKRKTHERQNQISPKTEGHNS